MKNAGKACNNRLYRHIRTFEKIVKNYFVIYSYIADRLLEPDTAMGQYNRIAEAIQSLNILPERCALVESEPERTQGLRQMLVDNYSVFYIVGEDAVSVARVLYSASDLVRRLRRMK